MDREATRCVVLDRTELVKNIGEYRYILEDMSKRYLDEFDGQDLPTMHLNYVTSNYRKTYDRLLIASQVCFGRFRDETLCEIPAELWTDMID
jgi:hypothetical protein